MKLDRKTLISIFSCSRNELDIPAFQVFLTHKVFEANLSEHETYRIAKLIDQVAEEFEKGLHPIGKFGKAPFIIKNKYF